MYTFTKLYDRSIPNGGVCDGVSPRNSSYKSNREVAVSRLFTVTTRPPVNLFILNWGGGRISSTVVANHENSDLALPLVGFDWLCMTLCYAI